MQALTPADIVANLQALRQRDPSGAELLFVRGHSAANDGGEGWFFWDSASAVDNDGTAVASTFGGTWHRVWDGVGASVRWFGANESNADNSPAFQNALDAAQQVNVPPGIYRLKQTIYIPDHHELRGVGATFKNQGADCQLHFDETTTQIYYAIANASFPSDPAFDIKIRDVAIRVDGPGVRAIMLRGARNCRIENVSIILAAWEQSGANQRGLQLQTDSSAGGCYYNVVDGLRIVGPGGGGNFDDGAIGVHLYYRSGSMINANVFRAVSVESCEFGVRVGKSNGNFFYGLTVEGARVCLRFLSDAERNVVYGLWYEGISTQDTVPLSFASGTQDNVIYGLWPGEQVTDPNDDQGQNNRWGKPVVDPPGYAICNPE